MVYERLSDQMVISKSCINDFNFTETICQNLQNGSYDEENVLVSKELNQYNVYKTYITSIFPVFFSFYLGAWADLFGRKPLFYLFLGKIVASFFY